MFELVDFDMGLIMADLISFTFTSEKGYYKGNSFAGYMKICSNPLCHSQDVKFSIRYANSPEDLSDENRKYIFYVDILTKKYHDKGIKENVLPDNIKFAEAFIHELSEENRQDLLDAFYEYKNNICETFDVEHLKITAIFSKDDIDEIDNKKVNISYHEIFPFAKDWEYDDEKFHYLIVDQYCLAPRCFCTKVILSISPWINKDISEKDTMVIEFDYKKKRWCLLENPSNLDSNQIIKGILKTIPDLIIQMKKRHEIMKKIYIKSKVQNVETTDVLEMTKTSRNNHCSCESE